MGEVWLLIFYEDSEKNFCGYNFPINQKQRKTKEREKKTPRDTQDLHHFQNVPDK